MFDNADDCLKAAYDMAAEGVIDAISDACEEATDPNERPRRGVQAVLDYLSSDPAVVALFGSEAAAGVPAIATARERLAALVAQKVSRVPARSSGIPAEIKRSMIAGGLAFASELVSSGGAKGLAALGPDLSQILAQRF